MKKSIQNTLLPLVCIFTFLLLTGLECNEAKEEVSPEILPDEKCGPKDESKQRIWSEGYYAINPKDHYSTVDNGWAFYSYSVPTIENVCAHEHVRVGFDIGYDPSYGDDILYEAEVMYGVLYTYPVTQWNAGSSSTNPGYIISWWWAEFGMKFLYGDDPGWMFPIMTIKIRDQGSPEANHEFFSEHIDWVSISPEYYKWKEKED